MKRLASLILLLAFSDQSAPAQGQLYFANENVPSAVITWTNGPGSKTGGFAMVGTEVELFYQPGSSSAPAPMYANGVLNSGSWEMTLGNNNPYALTGTDGQFIAGPQSTGTDVAPAGDAWLTVLAWSGASSFQLALSTPGSYAGESTVFELKTGEINPPILDSVLITSTPIAGSIFSGVVLEPVPEPSTIALVCLGGIGLLTFRPNRARRAPDASHQSPVH